MPSFGTIWGDGTGLHVDEGIWDQATAFMSSSLVSGMVYGILALLFFWAVVVAIKKMLPETSELFRMGYDRGHDDGQTGAVAVGWLAEESKAQYTSGYEEGLTDGYGEYVRDKAAIAGLREELDLWDGYGSGVAY